MNAHIHNLDKIFEDSLLDLKTIIVISDASIKNSITTSISHVHYGSIIQAKPIHYTINVTITNTIHLARRIFDFSLYPYQL